MATVRRSVQDTPIVMIGAGNLATNLAKALYRKGFRIAQVYSRTEESARCLAQVVEADYTTSFEEITADAKLYISALKDSALTDHISEICAGKRPDALFVHTAGSVPMSVWQGHASSYGVLYPLQTFSKEREVDFSIIPFFIEADSADNVELLKSVARTMTTKVYDADSDKRKALHLAAVFACNFTNHMYALANELLERYNLPFDTMLSLIDETACKVHKLSPKEAQTGPAIRYDRQVMEKHMAMLADMPELAHLYGELSGSIHKMMTE